MRTLLAIAILVGGTFAMSSAADAARKYRRSAEPYPYYSYGPQSRFSRQEVECERAWHEDPSGRYAGYPCWAREVFGRGTQGGGRGRR